MIGADTIEAGRPATTRPSWQTAVVVASWLVAAAGAIGTLVLVAGAEAGGALAQVVEPADATGAIVTIAMASVGAAIVLRGAVRGYGWIMLVAAAIVGVIGFAGPYAVLGLDVALPLSGAATWAQDLWMVTFLAIFLLTALFPDGEVASPGWRRPVRLMTITWVGFIVLFALIDRSATNFFLDVDGYQIPRNATGLLPIPAGVYDVTWFLLTLASMGIGLGSLVTRWRRADPESRLRIKWALFAFIVFLGVGVSSVVNGALISGAGLDLGLREPISVMSALSQVGLILALGFGVLKFRLYDIDLVINRTVVYSLLTLMIFAAYVGIVVGFGAVLPVDQSVLILVVTGLVAIVLAPLRSWLQTTVNRLMFGQRDDPYSVLAKLGRLLASSGAPEETLQSLVETIARSLKLPGASIQLEESGEWQEWASYGNVGEADAVVVIPVRHQGETVGRLLVAPRSHHESLSTQDISLLETIAQQAGALARSVRLTVALQRSRERLVMAQEEERRRIRHDLHDELGPSLASQTFQLDAVLELIDGDPDGARSLLAALKEQNQQLVADIRRLVYELRPPALDELGVAGALMAQTAQIERSGPMEIEVVTVPDPLPELPAAVDVAAYRIAREAITNSARHAGASRCTATLQLADGGLIVTIEDDGRGFDRTRGAGVGMISMRERTEELGGQFSITSEEGVGTRVRALLPVIVESIAPAVEVSHG